MFGTTYTGGLGDEGVVYRLHRDDHGRWRSNKLHSFCVRSCNDDGSIPVGNLIMDTAGNLYGVTREGGAADNGAVFELVRSGDNYSLKVVHSFDCSGGTDGCYPVAGLTYAGASSGAMYDGVSPLYGTTIDGGTDGNDGGTVYQLTKSGDNWDETILYFFCSLKKCADGAAPGSTLLIDDLGNMYGTTLAGGGGRGGNGVVFEILASPPHFHGAPDTLRSEIVLHKFCSLKSCADGGYGYGTVEIFEHSDALIMDGSGNLFGTTPGGGAVKRGCCGVVFEISTATAGTAKGSRKRNGSPVAYTVLHSFCALNQCRDGANPNGGLLMDARGAIFGTTQTGGGNNIDGDRLGGGTVFRLAGSQLQTLYVFCSGGNCFDGTYPYAGLATDGIATLFGTTEMGGPDAINENTGDGTVFEISR